MNVLSLFDGISCARVALARSGIAVKTYTAVEIEKNAIAISQKNYPEIIRYGDIRTFNPETKYDLLIGGSPCQDLSIAKKDRKGLGGDRSSLFWDYIRIKNECKPTWFILENVASMPKKDRDIITKEMGVQPIMINASLVSAQSRKRFFWTNIPFLMPEDRGILLKDILQPDAEVDERMVMKGKAFCLGASYSKVTPTDASVEYSVKKKQRTMVKVGHIGTSDAQANRVYDPDGKSCTLSANGGGLGAKTGLYKIGRDIGRRLDENGTRADHSDHPIQRRIETREDDKCGTLTSVQKDNLVVSEEKIRKLTPIECERLQGLPDNYTEGVAMTHRYKCLGNAFNVDVICSIFSGLTLRPPEPLHPAP